MSFQKEESARDLAQLKSYFITQFTSANKLCGLSGKPIEKSYIAEINRQTSLDDIVKLAAETQSEKVGGLGWGSVVPVGFNKSSLDAYAKIYSNVSTKKNSLLGTELEVNDSSGNGRAGDLVSAGTFARSNTAAPAGNEFNGIDPRIAQVLSSPASNLVKNQAILEINANNQSSAEDLIARFQGAGTPYSVPAPTRGGDGIVLQAASAAASILDQGDTMTEMNGISMTQKVKSQIELEIRAGNKDTVQNLANWFNEGKPASAEAVAFSNTADERIAQVINNPALGWNVKSKVILEIQAGNQDSNQNLINWFNDSKPASTAASALGATVEGKRNLLGTLPVAVKDQVMAEIQAGNPDSVGNLVDWFGAGNPPSSASERRVWAGGVGGDTAPNYSIPAPAAVMAAPTTPAPDGRIAAVNSMDVSQDIKNKIILEVQSGNQDSVPNLVTWFSGGNPPSAGATALGSTTSGKIGLVNASSMSPTIKSQIILEIQSGNQDSVSNLNNWFSAGKAASPGATAFSALGGGIGGDPNQGAMPAAVPTQTYGN